MWWALSILGYWVVAFVVFKAKYNRDMAEAIVRLHKAQEAYTVEEENSRGQPNYWISSMVSSELDEAKLDVRHRGPLVDAVIWGAWWPAYIFWGFGKLLYRVVFDNDVDKVARQKADKLLAEHLRVKELEAENKRLMNLAKEEGLIDNEHS